MTKIEATGERTSVVPAIALERLEQLRFVNRRSGSDEDARVPGIRRQLDVHDCGKRIANDRVSALELDDRRQFTLEILSKTCPLPLAHRISIADSVTA